MSPLSVQMLGIAISLISGAIIGFWIGARRSKVTPHELATTVAPAMEAPARPEPDKSTVEQTQAATHDLNNLLTVIQGRAELLASKLSHLRIDGVDAHELTAAISRAVSLAHRRLPRDISKPQTLQYTGYPQASSSLAMRQRGGNHAEIRILVVEDERTVATLVRCVLEQAGYHITTASSAAEALALLRDAPTGFDLLLSDVVMAQKNGIELATEVRARFPEIKVLLMSASSLPDLVKTPVDREAIKEMYFLQKPFSPTLLTQRVQEALQASAADIPSERKAVSG